MNLRPLLAALGLLAAAAHAAPLTPAAAHALEQQLDSTGVPAITNHDFEKIIRETFPPVVAMTGGHDHMIEQMRAAFAQMDAQHIKLVSHVSKSELQTTDAGQYDVVRVVEVSMLNVGDQRMKITSYSLAVRTKPDGPWTFIGGAGLAKTPTLAWRLLPDLPKDYKLPPRSTQQL